MYPKIIFVYELCYLIVAQGQGPVNTGVRYHVVVVAVFLYVVYRDVAQVYGPIGYVHFRAKLDK